MSVNDAVDFGVQMAEAIVAAQKPQKPRKPAKKTYVLHRDIKPSNIFYETVGGRKIYLLSDYGMARDTDPDSENGPTKQVVFENDNYSAPERKNGKTDITSDIYAVCKCIYRLLCNEEDWKTWSDDSNAITPDTGCSALNNILHGATLDDVKKRRYNDPKVFLNELQNLRINLLRSGEIIYPSEKKNEENSWKPVIPSSDILGLFSYNSPNQEETLVKIKEYGSGRAYLERECDEIIFNPYGVMDSDRTWAYQNYGHLLECGSLTAQEKLGFCDINGIGTIIDRKQGFQRILDSAKKGEDLARLWAGACYYDGCGTDVDLNKAKEYFQNCTIKPQAENCLSICANAIIREGQERDRELQMMAKRGKTRQKTRAKTKSRQVQSQQH
jgi:serine/threonine protein kinase